MDPIWDFADPFAPALVIDPEGGLAIAYNFGGMDTQRSLSGVETASFTYTPNGEVATKDAGGVTWSYVCTQATLLRELKEGSTVQATYACDGLGRRIKVEEGSPETWTASVVAGKDTIFEKDQSGAITKYVTANGMRVVRDCRSLSGKDYIGRVGFLTHASVGTRQEG